MLKRKTFSILLFLIVFAIILTGCGTSDASSDETTTLVLAENQSEDYPTTVGAKEFARLVEEKTDGRYKIKVYSGGQLGDEKDVLELAQLGAVDFARVNTIPLTEFSDDIGVLAMPFLFEEEEKKWEKLNGDVGRELLDTLEGSNLVGLSFYDSGERSFYNTIRPIETPEDMKGMKIRVQASEMAIDIVEALGASATPMEYGEVYSGLQTGIIDGGENNFPSYYTSGHYNVAPYFTVNGYQGVPEVLLGSEDMWKTLNSDDKEAFREAALESVDVQRESWAALTAEAKQVVVEAGSELVEIDDITPWRKAVQPVYDKYEDRYDEWIEKLTRD